MKAVKVVTYVLALIFLLSGGAKLAGLEFELRAFERWGYPLWFMYMTGLLEVAGGIAILIPRISALVSACLAALMVGAVGTHILNAEWAMMALATIILLTAAWRAMKGRDEIKALLTMLKST
jgi:putative oxidoreductase